MNICTTHNVLDTLQTDFVFVAKSLSLSLLTLLVLFGNGLVIASVFYSRQLRSSTTSYLIISLAITDLLVGAFLLPFSAANEVLGVWIFGDLWCQVFLAIDVWICTASIYHLVAIAIDRYIVIAKPNLLSSLNRQRGRFMILSAWLMSFVVSLPQMMHWPKEFEQWIRNDDIIMMSRNERATSLRLHYSSVINVTSVTSTATRSQEQFCTCSQMNYASGYIIFSAVMSFYLPMVTIILFYTLILSAVRKVSKSISCASSMKSQEFLSTSQPLHRQLSLPPLRRTKSKSKTNSTTNEIKQQDSIKKQAHSAELCRKRLSIPTTQLTTFLSPDNCGGGMGMGSTRMTRSARASLCMSISSSINAAPRPQPYVMVNPEQEAKRRMTILQCQSEHALMLATLMYERNALLMRNRLGSKSTPFLVQQEAAANAAAANATTALLPLSANASRRPSVQWSPSSRLRPTNDYQQNALSDTSLFARALRRASVNKEAQSKLLRALSARASWGRNRNSVRKNKLKIEICAAKTLSIVTGCFLISWLGFAIVYLLKAFPACQGAHNECVPRYLVSLAFWLGYVNSALNPLIYALFSIQFRRAFKRLLGLKRMPTLKCRCFGRILSLCFKRKRNKNCYL